MAQNIENAVNNLLAQLENLEKALSQVPLIQYGSISGSGWVYVAFPKPYGMSPAVLAVQTPVSPQAGNKKLTPPQVQIPQVQAPQVNIPQIQPPQLTPLQVQVPSPPVSWGQQAQQTIATYCGETLGQVPVIGGYLCSGVNATFGKLAYYVLNAIQSLYYAFDAQAMIQNIEKAVEYKSAQDWNAGIASLQNAVDQLVNGINSSLQNISNEINGSLATATNDVNSAISAITSAIQNFINFIYYYVNYAYGLAQDISIPVAQVRNVSNIGFEVYIPEGATVYWVSVG